MIDTRQYRVGNFIQSDGTFFNIDSISDKYIRAGALTVYVPNADNDEIDIPLTPELLEGVDWQGYKDLYFNSHFCLDKEGHLYYHNDYTGINIYYIHQLQNLYFSLTGKELTIKL